MIRLFMMKQGASSTQTTCASQPSTLPSGSNDSRVHVVEPPRGRSFIWQIGVNSSIQDRRQGSMAESEEIYSCV